MRVSLKELSIAIEAGAMALVGESAGYLILGAADSAIQHSRLTELNTITLNSDGLIELVGPEAESARVESSLRASLARLLTLCRRKYPNLDRVAHRQEARGLDILVGELEAALVPVNRKASKRSLARLFREVRRHQPSSLPVQESPNLSHDVVSSVLHSEIPTETPIDPVLIRLESIEEQTVVDASVEEVFADVEAVKDLAEPEVSAGLSADPGKDEDEYGALQCDFDESETTIFAPVLPVATPAISSTVDVEEQVALTPPPALGQMGNEAEPEVPSVESREAPFARTSIGAFGWSSLNTTPDDEPLITLIDEPETQGYSLNDLLESTAQPRPSSRLMRELRNISEVDHSPAPPEVK